MRIVTNPGSNLSDRVVERYRVHVVPQQIVVDGVAHDTRQGLTHEGIDHWVKTAREHPYVLGTSAAEFVDVFRKQAREDDEILAVMTSRKIVGSHTAAVAASRTIRTMPELRKTRVEVVDSMGTDVGTGLCTVLAGECARALRSVEETARICRRAASQSVMMFTLGTLEYLVKGGRASFLRAWIANVLDVTPLLSFVDGELVAVGKLSRSHNVEEAMVDALVTRLGGRRAVWLGVAHGGVHDRAAKAVAIAKRKLDVVYVVERPLSSSIYLHGGPGSLTVWATPIDRLGWTPPVPAPY